MPVDRTFTPEVERFLAGELTEGEAAALRAKLGEVELTRIRTQHEREQQALMNQRTPEDFARLIQVRATKERARRKATLGFWATTGLAAAAALMLWVAPSTPRSEQVFSGEAPAERLKGLKPELAIFRKSAADVETLAPNAEVRAHDVLQVAYNAGGMAFGAVLSIDGSGTVTFHFPYETDGEARLTPQGRHMLPRAYELDQAPAFERFFLITSKTRFDLAVVVNAAEELARDPKRAQSERLALPATFVQTSFMLRKVKP